MKHLFSPVAALFILCCICTANAQTIPKKFFGFDFWSGSSTFWNDVLNQIDSDTLQFGLMGTVNVSWRTIEPAAPVNGVHTYSWAQLDLIFNRAAQSGKVLEVCVLTNSNWGTVVADSNMTTGEPCCRMSPLKPDNLSDTLVWGMTANKAWYDFIYNLVERYDKDGVNDAPGLTAPTLEILVFGDEPEAPAHFFNHGGNMTNYEQMLSTTYSASKAANVYVQVARGKSNPASIFDDKPDSTLLWQRRGDYLDSLKKHFSLGGNNYDLFAINYNDHYTSLPNFTNWLSATMTYYGFQKPFMVTDARTTLYPRANMAPGAFGFVLPKIYPDSFMTIMETPTHAFYNTNKKQQQADEVKQSVRKVLTALATGQKYISLQPNYSSLVPIGTGDAKFMWLYSGFFDPYIYTNTGNLTNSREPIYWAMKQLANELVGANTQPQIYTLGNYVLAYAFAKNSNQQLFIWKDNPFLTDANNLMLRNQDTVVNLSGIFTSSQVLVKYFISAVDTSNGLPVPVTDSIKNTSAVRINETPVMIIPYVTTSDYSYEPKFKAEVFPSLVTGPIHLVIDIKQDANVKITVYDVLGAKMNLSLSKSLQPGSHRLMLNATSLGSGLYYIILRVNDDFKSFKIIRL